MFAKREPGIQVYTEPSDVVLGGLEVFSHADALVMALSSCAEEMDEFCFFGVEVGGVLSSPS